MWLATLVLKILLLSEACEQVGYLYNAINTHRHTYTHTVDWMFFSLCLQQGILLKLVVVNPIVKRSKENFNWPTFVGVNLSMLVHCMSAFAIHRIQVFIHLEKQVIYYVITSSLTTKSIQNVQYISPCNSFITILVNVSLHHISKTGTTDKRFVACQENIMLENSEAFILLYLFYLPKPCIQPGLSPHQLS